MRLAAHAAQALGWRPADFWAATPADLATSLGLTDAAPGTMLDRCELQRLMANDQTPNDQTRERDHDRPG